MTLTYTFEFLHGVACLDICYESLFVQRRYEPCPVSREDCRSSRVDRRVGSSCFEAAAGRIERVSVWEDEREKQELLVRPSMSSSWTFTARVRYRSSSNSHQLNLHSSLMAV